MGFLAAFYIADRAWMRLQTNPTLTSAILKLNNENILINFLLN